MITLDEQIKEIEREIAMREAVYQKRIAGGLMKRDSADKHMENIHAVLKTLYWLKDHEAKIKAQLGWAAVDALKELLKNCDDVQEALTALDQYERDHTGKAQAAG